MEKRASAVLAANRGRPIRRRASLKKRIKTFFAFCFLGLLTVIAIAAIYFMVLFYQVSKTLPSVAEIGNFTPSENTRIYYADGKLMATLATENRVPVKLSEISKYLIDATIATEDKRFYEHHGIDMYGIGRAVYRDIAGGEMREGASTITQQLARNINEFGLSREKKLRRKVTEALLAMRIEQAYSKDEILELYLNQVNYGAGAYGIEAASRTYFHKSAKNLTLGEAALLAGLPQRPTYYSAIQNRDAALRRRDVVLDRMVEVNKITPEQRDEVRQKTLKIYKAQPHGNQVFGAPYFVNYVISRLINAYGYDAVYSGWKIYTTLDSRIQDLAEKKLQEGVLRSDCPANQCALICLDSKTGYIRAMVGGIDYKRDQFNVVTSGLRQPGSSFKPIVYTAALDTGKATLDTSFRDDPSFPGERRGSRWHPKNYNGTYSYADMTVLNAIKHSINTVAVKVAMVTGLHTVIDYARRMGINSPIDAYPTLALGASAVRPIELCSAYTTFANNGRRALPMGIVKVIANNGDSIEEHSPETVDVGLKPQTIEAMNTALQEVVLHGTGTAAAAVPNAHGKTGTTSNNIDAWFAGYTPELTTIIWVSREHRAKNGKLDRRTPYLPMSSVTGGSVVAPIWREFMLKALPIQQSVYHPADTPANPTTPKPIQGVRTAGHTEIPRQTPKSIMPHNPSPGQVSPVPNDNIPIQPSATPDQTGPTTPQTTAPSPGNKPPDPTFAQPKTTAPTTPSPITAAPKPPPSQHATAQATRISEPVVRRTDPRDEMVTVRLCADSHRRATQWCPVTVERRMRRRDIPGPCKLHHAPPGERDQ